MQADDFKGRLKSRFASYGSISAGLAWLEKNRERANALFENKALRDFIFEPILGVFEMRMGACNPCGGNRPRSSTPDGR